MARTLVEANFAIPPAWLRNVSFASSPKRPNGAERFCGNLNIAGGGPISEELRGLRVVVAVGIKMRAQPRSPFPHLQAIRYARSRVIRVHATVSRTRVHQ